MSDENRIWPEFYPEGTPPKEAVVTQGVSFRLVENSPPLKTDFQSTYEENPARCKNYSIDRLRIACGTSHFKKIEDIKRKRSLFPPLKNKQIAKGNLVEQLGLMMETCEPSHLTVWYQINSEPQEYFVTLDE